jgi:hypothetical protein
LAPQKTTSAISLAQLKQTEQAFGASPTQIFIFELCAEVINESGKV